MKKKIISVLFVIAAAMSFSSCILAVHTGHHHEHRHHGTRVIVR